MNYKSIGRSAAAVVAGLLFATAAAVAAGPASNTFADMSGRRDVLSGGTDDTQQPAASGDVAELQQMIRDGKVRELRTTYNGSYGASLLYYPDEKCFITSQCFSKRNSGA